MTNVNMEPTMAAVAGTAPARPPAAPLTGEQPKSDKLPAPASVRRVEAVPRPHGDPTAGTGPISPLAAPLTGEPAESDKLPASPRSGRVEAVSAPTSGVVTAIPATKPRTKGAALAPDGRRRRVAAYARVSTDRDEQVGSYEAQIDYYTRLIQSRPDWELAGVYADEGISGTTVNRPAFQRMVTDALAGRIDLIITKSVSRFARNTVDSLSTIRTLKARGVECYFEKENIWTFDGKGELLITIMSSLAQEESRSISENSTWGRRKRFADGEVSVAYSTFLGYDRGPDGGLVINPAQAELVRRIYRMFLDQGLSPYRIARQLTEEGVPSPAGKSTWYGSTVESILTNEKYKGDALLQKSFTVDYLTKRVKRNEGEVPQWYVTGDHEAIIPPDEFDRAQREMARRKEPERRWKCGRDFCGKVFCGQDGGLYGPQTRSKGLPSERHIWQCRLHCHRASVPGSGTRCTTPILDDRDLEEAYVRAVKQAALMGLADKAKAEADRIEPVDDESRYRKSDLDLLARTLGKAARWTIRYDPTAMRRIVERFTVHTRDRIQVTFIDGTTITV